MDPLMSAQTSESDAMSGGARGRKPLGCKLKKAECAKKSDCVWIVGKGCRHEDNVPLGVLAKAAKAAKAAKPKTPSPPKKAKTPSPPKAKTPSPPKKAAPKKTAAKKPAAKKTAAKKA